jgi:hypothetical protein
MSDALKKRVLAVMSCDPHGVQRMLPSLKVQRVAFDRQPAARQIVCLAADTRMEGLKPDDFRIDLAFGKYLLHVLRMMLATFFHIHVVQCC